MLNFILIGLITMYQSVLLPPNPALFQKWLQTNESGPGGFETYRPTSFEYPYGFSTSGMRFKKDGSFILYETNQDNEIVQFFGSWESISKAQMEISFHKGEKRNFIVEIKKLKSSLLIVDIKKLGSGNERLVNL